MSVIKDGDRTVFISDCHLGCRYARIGLLRKLLREVRETRTIQKVVLVGDIIDGWRLRRTKHNHWSSDCNMAVRDMLSLAKGGVELVYIAGNHDDFLRTTGMTDIQLGSRVKIRDQYTHVTAGGDPVLCIHGDQFDASIRYAKWLVHLGDQGYDMMLWLSAGLDWIQSSLGVVSTWSLSKTVKQQAKKSISLISDFESFIRGYAESNGYKSVVCGHIHMPTIVQDQGLPAYYNCGDWVENATAIVEGVDGEFRVVDLLKEQEEMNAKSA